MAESSAARPVGIGAIRGNLRSRHENPRFCLQREGNEISLCIKKWGTLNMLRSRNYPPSPELAPYIARHYVFSAELPADFELIDRLLSETAFIRILLKGDWTAETEPDQWTNAGPIVFFGPNSRPLRVRVRGAFHVVGIAFRPCGWRGVFQGAANLYADRMMALRELWDGGAQTLFDAIAPLREDSEIVAAAEEAVSAQLRRRGSWHFDPDMQVFERIARHDSTMKVQDAAAVLGLSPRQLERQCLGTFGHSPKMVLRRSRFLDMAAAMRGLGNPSDDELAALRYFDQSHLNREFRRFSGMTPGQFASTPTPLLTAGLELRTLRKAEPGD